MEINVHVYAHADPETQRKLDTILVALQSIKRKEDLVDADLQAIVDQAKADNDVEQAAIGALNSLFTKLLAALAGTGPISAEDRATLQATVQSMKDNVAAVAAAIVADTPADSPAPATT